MTDSWCVCLLASNDHEPLIAHPGSYDHQIDPRTGAKLGRPRGRYPTFADHLARLTAAEPHATAERLIELEREAARATRQPAAYYDVTVSFSKSISVLHASIRENERQARMGGDQQTSAYWAGCEQRFQEVLHKANRAALEYLQAWAGITRTGYHGTRIDGREPGRFEPAGLIITSWLQGTSRDGDPQDHIHATLPPGAWPSPPTPNCAAATPGRESSRSAPGNQRLLAPPNTSSWIQPRTASAPRQRPGSAIWPYSVRRSAPRSTNAQA